MNSTDPMDAGSNSTPQPQDALASSSATTLDRPYLQIFGPDTGVFEYCLGDGTITIGRSDNAHVRLPHHSVSRVHALLAYRENQYVIEDAGSNYGVVVNSKRIQSHVLQHGDTMQISLYVLQFRTHPVPPGASAASARAKFLLRTEFCMLPSTMRLQYRPLNASPKEVFRSGDTLRVGHGGLLIPTENDPGETVCLELSLCWPSQQTKCYLGEVMGVIQEAGLHWLCVKLHSVPTDIHEAVLAGGDPGEWVSVRAT